MRTIFIILALFLFTNKSNSQKTMDVGDCLFEQLGFQYISSIFELIGIIFSMDEEKLYAYLYSHPEILYATSYCMTKPEIILKYEAEKIINNFFGVSYKISVVIFDKQYTLSEGFPKITFKFKNNCDIDLNLEGGYYKIEGETVISQKGMENTLTNDLVKFCRLIIN